MTAFNYYLVKESFIYYQENLILSFKDSNEKCKTIYIIVLVVLRYTKEILEFGKK